MNIQQINNNLQIKDFLEKSGISPAHGRGNHYWYISPIRETESTPSFKVDTVRNRWYDFGAGEGGKLFDLARRLYGSNDISEVIKKVTDLFLLSSANNGYSITGTSKQQQDFSRKQDIRNDSGNFSNASNRNRLNSNKEKIESLAESPRIIIEAARLWA
ncbi:CHC2 zinc finger domain-containing protein [uncultured Mucilaginibacter sp.]|uniref:CHC2 zinc finger domain-containing protein n=1 Tax=uncultured Mucilaginibacter sp. TaxID=797541 RepID=UPI002607C30F|nr:CHC2 zinc finger domain-containing protein [uncultured Mucilaginibacter sp.]